MGVRRIFLSKLGRLLEDRLTENYSAEKSGRIAAHSRALHLNLYKRYRDLSRTDSYGRDSRRDMLLLLLLLALELGSKTGIS